ncbi:MAG: hypothetical protein CMD43_05430 [Gammaproteobacteria bacterium]|nr:hypothetical protein [Gammaproteobacteria bacterium]|tara:strand:+ start:121 stop:351 length:231 start_codon:yes stop_codon:yes gene_type:complete
MSLSKVIWKCRKGIREIDILLSRYTKEVYPNLSIDEQKIFSEFLDQDTFEILDVLVNNKTFNKKFIKIVEALKTLN